MNPLNKGEIVWLKSGGPKMTIKERIDKDTYCCIWFQGGDIQLFDFEYNLLSKSDPFECTDHSQRDLKQLQEK